jgi:RNA polymerase sigma factor (TIGR02999 family)
MHGEGRGDLSALLAEARAGVDGARDRLVVEIYSELHRMASGMMRREKPGTLLQPSALVNEAVMRLLKGGVLERASDRHYLFAAAAEAMRRVLIDYARKRVPGQQVNTPLDEMIAQIESQNLDVVSLNLALDRLFEVDPDRALVVTLKFFVGMTIPEMAEALGVAEATVEYRWRFARAWLHNELCGNGR